MAGRGAGALAVVDRAGVLCKRMTLPCGVYSIGRDVRNDVRIALPTVQPHHATLIIQPNKPAVLFTNGTAETVVNKQMVRILTLRHEDLIAIGGRLMRWDYLDVPTGYPRRMYNGNFELIDPVGWRLREMAEAEAQQRRLELRLREMRGRPQRPRACSVPANTLLAREEAAQKALEMAHRASMPGTSAGKQVAIVQPQRRNEDKATDVGHGRGTLLSSESRQSYIELGANVQPEEVTLAPRARPFSYLQSTTNSTTQATLWIESRKAARRRRNLPRIRSAKIDRPYIPRRRRPSKAAIRKAKAKKANAKRLENIKIAAPSTIDYTKQAAIMLMTGHTSRTNISIAPKSPSSPSYVVKKPSPVRKTPRGGGGRPARGSQDAGGTPSDLVLSGSTRSSTRNTTNRTVSILELSDSTRNTTARSSGASTSAANTKSPALPSPKKSAMKDRSKKSSRKMESIKFDFSNLEGHRSSALNGTSSTNYQSDESEDIALRYCVSSDRSQSPSPRRSIHSRARSEHARSSLIPALDQPSTSRVISPVSLQARRSLRSSPVVQQALKPSPDRTRSDLSASDRTRSDFNTTVASDRTRSDLNTTVASDRTRSDLSTTLAPGRAKSRSSVKTNASKTNLTKTLASDRTRSDLSSTVVSDRTLSDLSANTTAPERTRPRASTKQPSPSRTRTLSPRHNLESYSVVDLVSFDSKNTTKSVYGSADSDASEFGTPATSGRKTRSTINLVLLGSSTPYVALSRPSRSKSSPNVTRNDRTSVKSTRRSKSLTTPENGQPAVVTRVPRASRSRSRIHDDLSLLDLTEPGDSSPRTSKRSRNNASEAVDSSGDKTDLEGTTTPENRQSPEVEGTPVLSIRSLLDSSQGSVNSVAKTRDSERETSGPARRSRLRLSQEPAGSEDEGIITPISVAKPSPEAVKNKHSTAKKPQSKRTIIDDLNRSDIVKQLFGSPVKRKLTQSMSEFSRKRLFEDDDSEDDGPARRPTRRTLATGATAPALIKTSKPSVKKKSNRKSVKNDLTDVRGVKAVFGKKPKDDLRRVTGVRSLFQSAVPANDLTDVRGVRNMFQKKSPANDLRNVSGVKRLMRKSPKNDLTDVRGVRRMFKQKPEASYRDVSGIEELYQTRDRSADSSEGMFDALVGRPPIKAVYSRTPGGSGPRRTESRRPSLPAPASVDNVEVWLERELRRKLPSAEPTRESSELRKLATDTVEGAEPILEQKSRKSSSKERLGGRSVATPVPKRSSLVTSPVRARRPPQSAVHSTPLKGRLKFAMNASELGRVSPIAGPYNYPQIYQECFISLSSELPKDVKIVSAKTRSPRKQKSPKKREVSIPKESPKKSKRRANTIKRKSGLVVTKKAPAMSPTGGTKKKAAQKESPQKKSPKVGTSKTRSRAAKAAVDVKAAEPSQIEPKAKATRARKVAEKKPESPKASPKGRKTRAAAVKSKSPAKKTRKNAIDQLESVVAQPSLPKRARKTNASNLGETSKSGKTVEPKPQTEKKVKTRAKKDQTTVQETEEKKTNARGKKVQFDIDIPTEPTTRRGRKAKQEESEPKTRGNKSQSPSSEQSQPTARGRRAKPEVVVKEPRGGKRKAAIEEDPTNVIPPKRGKTTDTPAKKTGKQKAKDVKVENKKDDTKKSAKATKPKPVAEPVKTETTRARGRKAAEPKDKVTESTRGKRKATVDPSPAKAAAKKAASEPAPRARRAARPPPPPEVATKAVRGRKK